MSRAGERDTDTYTVHSERNRLAISATLSAGAVAGSFIPDTNLDVVGGLELIELVIHDAIFAISEYLPEPLSAA